MARQMVYILGVGNSSCKDREIKAQPDNQWSSKYHFASFLGDSLSKLLDLLAMLSCLGHADSPRATCQYESPRHHPKDKYFKELKDIKLNHLTMSEMHRNATSNPLGQLLAPPLSLQDLTIPEPMTGKALDCYPQQEIQGSEAAVAAGFEIGFEMFREFRWKEYGDLRSSMQYEQSATVHPLSQRIHVVPHLANVLLSIWRARATNQSMINLNIADIWWYRSPSQISGCLSYVFLTSTMQDQRLTCNTTIQNQHIVGISVPTLLLHGTSSELPSSRVDLSTKRLLNCVLFRLNQMVYFCSFHIISHYFAESSSI